MWERSSKSIFGVAAEPGFCRWLRHWSQWHREAINYTLSTAMHDYIFTILDYFNGGARFGNNIKFPIFRVELFYTGLNSSF
jgi:hypothetical protein